ncbi:MAG: GIY-YIG nuclease family protein [Actinomycetales bacterium]|nr:GIY-YIG nuclease family protein [Actinomycetales bacterium]
MPPPSPTSSPRCLAAGSGPACAGGVDADAPVALCERHLGLAADWAASRWGRLDVLPGPCRVCGSRLGTVWPSGRLCAVCEWPWGETVDDELPPPRVDVVYYLRHGERVKIGTSANPRQRLAALPYEELLGFERGGRGLEARRHAQFAADRFPRSEWFRLSAGLARHVAVVAAGVDDPWELYARWVSEALALRG